MLFMINKILFKKVFKIKKIKVIQVISDSNIGGTGKVVLNLLSCFDRNKIDFLNRRNLFHYYEGT